MADETPRTPTPEELAAIELRHALANMGPDTDRALMVTLRLPDSTHVADVWLSTADVTALTDGAISMSLVSHAEQQARTLAADAAAAPLPHGDDLDTDALCPDDVKELTDLFDAILNTEDGDA
jgi:hypothetical protein